MKHAAIPTKYNGVQFRSRLEAKWAAFFDIAGWPWQYEPYDLNGWIPDFALSGVKGNEVLVEVKPITWHASRGELQTAWMADDAELSKAFAHAEYVHDKREILVLGSNIRFDVGHAPGGIAIGAFLAEGKDREVDPAALYAGHGRGFDFAGCYGGWNYRIGGESDGDHHLKHADPSDAAIAWAEAGNIVQWRRK